MDESEHAARHFAGQSGSLRLGVLGSILATLVLAACAKPGVPGTSPTASATASSTASAAAAVVARVDCGTYALSQGEKTPDSAYQCFIKAVGSRRPAKLKETRPTTEGDAIPVTFVADGSGLVEVITDSRRDKFGQQVITRETCSGPIIVGGGLMFTTCTEARPTG